MTKKLKCYYVYMCQGCRKISYAHFFKRHKLGYIWREKCEKCSMLLENGKAAYMQHIIIGKMEKAIELIGI